MTIDNDANEHNFIKPTMTDIHSYEVMIRKRGSENFASYCPQLNVMFKGKTQDDVKNQLNEYIRSYIQQLEIGGTE